MNAVLEARGNPRRAAGRTVPMHHRSRGEAMSRETRIQKIAAVAAVLGFGTVVAQSPHFNRAARLSPDPLPVLLPSAVAFGAPLAGLGASDLESFVDGLEDFSSVDTAASGLGPIFNNVSCVA